MPSWPVLAQSAFYSGVVLSLVLTTIMVLSSGIASDMWVRGYPPDIRAKYGAMSSRARRFRPYTAVAFILSMLTIPLLGLLTLRAETVQLPFLLALIFGFLALLTFNAYDLVVLDWLIFCTLQPRWIILPGTEGMAGYRNYRFHFFGFLKGLAYCLIGGLIIALLWVPLAALAH